MPNNYINNRAYWDDMSNIDYITAFVKSWLAFNAWYRTHYELRSDREIIDQIKHYPNPIRNRAISMLKNKRVESRQINQLDSETVDFRSQIASLHDRLDKYPLVPFNRRAREYLNITFNNVHIKKRIPTRQVTNYSRFEYSVTPTLSNANTIRRIVSEVKNSRSVTIAMIDQERYDEAGLREHPEYAKLQPNQQARLLLVYRDTDPEPMVDLLNNCGDEIDCGIYQFKSTSEDLFAGTVEIIYSMRCMLFHGELEPSGDAQKCYESAYKILKSFLSLIPQRN